MKNYAVTLVILLIIQLSVFSQPRIAVTAGYGEGSYKIAPRSVNVWAAVNPPNMVFDRWTGDANLLASPTAWHTTVSLSQANINLTANYRLAPNWNPTYEIINGSSFGYYFPANSRGIVFRFHGGNGNGSSFFTKSEDRTSANDLVAAGFAVISLDSSNRVAKQWSTVQPPNNPDLTNVQALINLFISRGLITQATPIFTLGMSNGGAFSPRAAYWLSISGANVKGAAVYCAQGDTFAGQSNVPTIWNLASNDGSIGASGNQAAYDAYQILIGRHIPTQYNVNLPSPVYAERFARIPGLTVSDSQIIYNSLKNNNYLGRGGYLIQDPNISNIQTAIPPAYNSYRSDIGDQLNACFTAHQFFSDFDSRVIAFFNAQIP